MKCTKYGCYGNYGKDCNGLTQPVKVQDEETVNKGNASIPQDSKQREQEYGGE